ncbi:MAG: hypothetical protein WCK63_13835 [Betaproteobacteria bacterium]
MNKFCTTLLIAFFVSGCAHQKIVEVKNIDSTDRAKIKKIALLRINAPQQVTIRNQTVATSAAVSGVIGYLIEGTANEDYTKQYVSELNKQKVTFVPELAAAIQKELKNNGYQVEYLENQFARLKEDKTVDYSGINTDADAILNVFYGRVGYASPIGQKYSPWVNIAAVMIDPKTQNRMFSTNMVVHPNADKQPKGNVIYLMPKSVDQFSSFEEIMSSFKVSTDAIIEEEEKIAVLIAQQLK